MQGVVWALELWTSFRGSPERVTEREEVAPAGAFPQRGQSGQGGGVGGGVGRSAGEQPAWNRPWEEEAPPGYGVCVDR